MDSGIGLGQPSSVDVRYFARRFREWVQTASPQWGKARGDSAKRSFTTHEARDRPAGTMIRPSTHERVALACSNQDWP